MKTCTKCTKVHDLSQPLPNFKGWQDAGSDGKLALFNCTCGSTLAVWEKDLSLDSKNQPKSK